MRLDPPALGPGVGIVVVADIGEEEARLGLVDDDADVAADPHRPEMRVAGAVDAVEVQPGCRRVHLQIERRGLGRLLLLRSASVARAEVKVAAMRNSITHVASSRPRDRERG